jgi:hypothetical protein
MGSDRPEFYQDKSCLGRKRHCGHEIQDPGCKCMAVPATIIWCCCCKKTFLLTGERDGLVADPVVKMPRREI